MSSVGRRRVWSVVGALLAVSCLLPKAELVDDDSSVARATGGSSSTPANCLDANHDRCESKSCAAKCPATSTDSGYCLGACSGVFDCVKRNPGCSTAADPVCAAREAGRPKACTTAWESAGESRDSGPSAFAFELIQCLCGK
jgi:hypothetical protein